MLTVQSTEELNLFLVINKALIEVLSLDEDMKMEGILLSLKELIEDIKEDNDEEIPWAIDSMYTFIGYDLGETHLLLKNDISSTSDFIEHLEKMAKGVSFAFTLTTEE